MTHKTAKTVLKINFLKWRDEGRLRLLLQGKVFCFLIFLLSDIILLNLLCHEELSFQNSEKCENFIRVCFYERDIIFVFIFYEFEAFILEPVKNFDFV